MQHWSFDPKGPDQADLRQIARLLADGGVAILPTDTLYGLHACATDAGAIARIYATKERGDTRPLLVICADAEQLRAIGAEVTPEVERGLDALWPAPLTAIVPLRVPIPPSAGGATIGARVPDLPWLRALLELTGPLASTSVNRSGGTPVIDPDDVPPEILAAVDGIAVAGVLSGSPSTIVDFTIDPPGIVRDGAFFFSQKLWKTVRKTL